MKWDLETNEEKVKEEKVRVSPEAIVLHKVVRADLLKRSYLNCTSKEET